MVKEGNVLFNDTLNTFYLWLYGIRYKKKKKIKKREKERITIVKKKETNNTKDLQSDNNNLKKTTRELSKNVKPNNRMCFVCLFIER